MRRLGNWKTELSTAQVNACRRQCGVAWSLLINTSRAPRGLALAFASGLTAPSPLPTCSGRVWVIQSGRMRLVDTATHTLGMGADGGRKHWERGGRKLQAD